MNTAGFSGNARRFGVGRRDWTHGVVAIAAAGALLGGLLALAPRPAGVEPPAKAAQPAKTEALDTVIFKDGRVLKGRVISQTDTTVTVQGEVGGIPFKTEYSRADILDVKIAEKPAPDPKAVPTPGTPEAKPAVKPAPKAGAVSDPADDTAKKVYTIELTGRFGRDISQTPIRAAVDDAKNNGADVLIFMIENDWSYFGQVEKSEDDSAFEELFRAEDMDEIFSDEIPQWPKPPRVVFWVKKAMGGAAFLGLACPEIYFHSEGKMGGIGGLNQILGDIGDDVVRRKLYSARLGHAEGIANRGGYSYMLVRAMAITEYVLSVSFDGANPVYAERDPEDTGEVLLTDDGKDDNKDTDASIVAGEGNDVLTFNAKLAKDLLVSKGTADTLDDLRFEMGLSRNSTVVKGKSAQIMKSWRDGVNKAERDIRRLLQDAKEVPQGTTFDERTRARGKEKNILRQIQAILDRYGEAFGKSAANREKARITDRINEIDNQQQREAQAERRRK